MFALRSHTLGLLHKFHVLVHKTSSFRGSTGGTRLNSVADISRGARHFDAGPEITTHLKTINIIFIMVLWSDIDVTVIETVQLARDRSRFRYNGGPLRFQVPRGLCTWGVNSFKSFQVQVTDENFIQWWRALEAQLCPVVDAPFSSNLKEGGLRIKIDDAVYIFDQNSKQINPEVKEGLLRGQEVSCLIDVDSTYFFNGNWGLTVRAFQVKTWTDAPCVDETPPVAALPPGVCAFLPIS